MTERAERATGQQATGQGGSGQQDGGQQDAPPIVELRNVSKHFGGVVAIADLSLQVAEGEVVALVGNNGAGKSTVMRMVCGVHTPDTGEILVSGEGVRFRSPREARAHGIEAVPQELALAGYLSVAANIFLGREIAWGRGPLAPLSRRKMRARAGELVTSFGVHIPDMGIPVRDLSGGQQQGVAISRAMAWGSRLVVLDEPTAALGVHETAQVEEAIGRMSSHGAGVLLVSHQLDQVFRVAGRVYVLRHGQLVGHRRTAGSSPDEVVALITGSEAGGPEPEARGVSGR
jgi:simple sugar transport system ATP-binding protein